MGDAIDGLRELAKGGPYIGPRGGKYKDAARKIPWSDDKPSRKARTSGVQERPTRRVPAPDDVHDKPTLLNRAPIEQERKTLRVPAPDDAHDRPTALVPPPPAKGAEKPKGKVGMSEKAAEARVAATLVWTPLSDAQKLLATDFEFAMEQAAKKYGSNPPKGITVEDIGLALHHTAQLHQKNVMKRQSYKSGDAIDGLEALAKGEGGWQPIPNGKKGGQRKYTGKGYRYRYPDGKGGWKSRPTKGVKKDAATQKLEERGKQLANAPVKRATSVGKALDIMGEGQWADVSQSLMTDLSYAAKKKGTYTRSRRGDKGRWHVSVIDPDKLKAGDQDRDNSQAAANLHEDALDLVNNTRTEDDTSKLDAALKLLERARIVAPEEQRSFYNAEIARVQLYRSKHPKRKALEDRVWNALPTSKRSVDENGKRQVTARGVTAKFDELPGKVLEFQAKNLEAKAKTGMERVRDEKIAARSEGEKTGKNDPIEYDIVNHVMEPDALKTMNNLQRLVSSVTDPVDRSVALALHTEYRTQRNKGAANFKKFHEKTYGWGTMALDDIVAKHGAREKVPPASKLAAALSATYTGDAKYRKEREAVLEALEGFSDKLLDDKLAEVTALRDDLKNKVSSGKHYLRAALNRQDRIVDMVEQAKGMRGGYSDPKNKGTRASANIRTLSAGEKKTAKQHLEENTGKIGSGMLTVGNDVTWQGSTWKVYDLQADSSLSGGFGAILVSPNMDRMTDPIAAGSGDLGMTKEGAKKNKAKQKAARDFAKRKRADVEKKSKEAAAERAHAKRPQAERDAEQAAAKKQKTTGGLSATDPLEAWRKKKAELDKKSMGLDAIDGLEVLVKAGPHKYKSRKKVKGKWVYDYGEGATTAPNREGIAKPGSKRAKQGSAYRAKHLAEQKARKEARDKAATERIKNANADLYEEAGKRDKTHAKLTDKYMKQGSRREARGHDNVTRGEYKMAAYHYRAAAGDYKDAWNYAKTENRGHLGETAASLAARAKAADSVANAVGHVATMIMNGQDIKDGGYASRSVKEKLAKIGGDWSTFLATAKKRLSQKSMTGKYTGARLQDGMHGMKSKKKKKQGMSDVTQYLLGKMVDVTQKLLGKCNTKKSDLDAIDGLERLTKAGPHKYKSRKKVGGKWVYDYGDKKGKAAPKKDYKESERDFEAQVSRAADDWQRKANSAAQQGKSVNFHLYYTESRPGVAGNLFIAHADDGAPGPDAKLGDPQSLRGNLTRDQVRAKIWTAARRLPIIDPTSYKSDGDALSLLKGMYGFEDRSGEKLNALPDNLLPQYLSAFVEEAYEHEKRECEHRKNEPAGHDERVRFYAMRIMNELVMCMRQNSDLARAAKGVTADSIANILRNSGLIQPDVSGYSNPSGNGLEPMAYSERHWSDLEEPLDKGKRPAELVEKAHAAFTDDRIDPFVALRKAQAAARRDAWRVREVPFMAKGHGDCPIHGYRDLTKMQNLQNIYGKCTCS